MTYTFFKTNINHINTIERLSGWPLQDIHIFDSIPSSPEKKLVLEPCVWRLVSFDSQMKTKEVGLDFGDGSRLVSERLAPRTMVFEGFFEVSGESEGFEKLRDIDAFFYQGKIKLAIGEGPSARVFGGCCLKSSGIDFEAGTCFRHARITLEIFLSDPVAYGLERNNFTFSSQPFSLTTDGTLPAQPIFWVDVGLALTLNPGGTQRISITLKNETTGSSSTIYVDAGMSSVRQVVLDSSNRLSFLCVGIPHSQILKEPSASNYNYTNIPLERGGPWLQPGVTNEISVTSNRTFHSCGAFWRDRYYS